MSDNKIAIRLYNRRQRRNALFVSGSIAATVFGLFWLGWLLATLLFNGLSGLQLDLFTRMTPPPGATGGLLNAITGSLIMIVLAIVVGTPIGILAGTYLAEYGRHTRIANIIRILNDIMLSAPSIAVGLFIYEALVLTMGHFSALAGAFALAVIVIPVVVRTTENMLLLIPDSLREAAAALGAPKAHIIGLVTWKAAQSGIITGILLAIARISGETAPLLFTALNNQFWNVSLIKPMASLPIVIFQFAMSPYAEWHRLAWAGALLVTMAVLGLNILARIWGTRRS